MRRALIVASVVIASSGACSDYGAAEAPANDGDGGSDATVAEGGGDDATSDAGASDGGSDAAGDGGCDATFCDDFDTPPLGATWTSKTNDDATTELVDGGRSAPFAMKAVTPAGAFRGRDGRLSKRFTGVKGVRCSFAVMPIERSGQQMIIQIKGVAPEVDSWDVWVRLTPNETRLGGGETFKDGGVTPYMDDFAPVLPLAQWTNLEIETDLAKTVLKVDGFESATFVLPVPVSTSLVDVYLGILAFETTQQVALFDDLRCVVTN